MDYLEKIQSQIGRDQWQWSEANKYTGVTSIPFLYGGRPHYLCPKNLP